MSNKGTENVKLILILFFFAVPLMVQSMLTLSANSSDVKVLVWNNAPSGTSPTNTDFSSSINVNAGSEVVPCVVLSNVYNYTVTNISISVIGIPSSWVSLSYYSLPSLNPFYNSPNNCLYLNVPADAITSTYSSVLVARGYYFVTNYSTNVTNAYITNATANFNLNVQALTTTPAMVWNNVPSVIELNSTNTMNVTVSLANVGSAQIYNISLSTSGPSWFTLSPTVVNTLDVSNSSSCCADVVLSFSPPNASSSATYNASLYASGFGNGGSVHASSSFYIKVGAPVSRCMSDVDCTSGKFCYSGTCYSKFSDGASCCINGLCQANYCQSNFCDNNQYCSSHPTNGTNNTSGCTSDVDCGSGKFCYSGVCYGKYSDGTSCIYNGVTYANWCQSGYCVNGLCSSNTSASTPCTSDSQCSSTQFCFFYPANLGPSGGYCKEKLPSGSNCFGNDQCQSNICANTTGSSYPICLATQCNSDSDCISTQFCNFGSCIEKLTAGSPCKENNQCRTNICSNGYCSGSDNTSSCPSTITCPDTYKATCYAQFNINTSTCGYCNPDCTGHNSTTDAVNCGDGKCESGETYLTCPNDCQNPSINSTCQVNQTSTSIYSYSCNSTQTCPPIPVDAASKCQSLGGTPYILNYTSGVCSYVSCEFNNGTAPNPVVGQTSCPNATEINDSLSMCIALQLKGEVKFEGECEVPVCVQPPSESSVACHPITDEDIANKTNFCASFGNFVPKREFNPDNGCPLLVCAAPDSCLKEFPAAAVSRCEGQGGKFVVKQDNNSCIVYEQCVLRGDDRFSLTDRPSGIPDNATLANITLKLEATKTLLLEIKAKAQNLTDYYTSKGENTSYKFQRIISMINAAISKINIIESQIKNETGNMTVDDVAQIRYEIKYINDVVIKDILYLMLSNTGDAQQIENGTVKNCGSDSSCFDRAFRVCQNSIYSPQSANASISSPYVVITGLENGNCTLAINMTLPNGTQANMICKTPNFALGIDNPVTDLLPYCVGTLADIMKEWGGPAKATGLPFPPADGGPGGCTTLKACAQYCLSNRPVCEAWADQHPAYGSVPTNSTLQQIANS